MNKIYEKIKFKKFLDKNPNRKFEDGKRLKNSENISTISNPKISIITVIKNKSNFIEETILSVKNQKYKNIEHIIIDGGSTDGSLEIIKKYIEDIDYFVSEPDKGNYDAINKGLSVCTGDLIGIVNADDILLPDATSILVNNYNQYQDVDFFSVLSKNTGVY